MRPLPAAGNMAGLILRLTYKVKGKRHVDPVQNNVDSLVCASISIHAREPFFNQCLADQAT